MEIFNNWLASNSTDWPILGVSDYKCLEKEGEYEKFPGIPVVSTWHFHMGSIPWGN